MPPVDLPRGNAAKPVTPRPASAYRNPPPTPPTFAGLPHGRGVISTPRPAPPRPASAYRNPPAPVANVRTANNPRGTSIVAAHIAAKSAPMRANTPAAQQQAIRGRLTDYAASHPLAPLVPYGPLTEGGSAKLRLQAELGQIYQGLKAQHLLPADAHMPDLSIIANAGPGAYTVGTGGRGGHIFYGEMPAIAATDASQGSMHSWALQGLIHELAHSFQSPRTQQSIPLREGGAQAYADAAGPAVLGPLAVSDSNYAGYVQRARRRGPDWYMREQFGGS